MINVCRMNSTTVQINIQNINDNQPVFVDANGVQINAVTVSIEEQQPIQNIYQIRVSLLTDDTCCFIVFIVCVLCVWQLYDRDGDLNELDVSLLDFDPRMLGYFDIDKYVTLETSTLSENDNVFIF